MIHLKKAKGRTDDMMRTDRGSKDRSPVLSYAADH